MEGFKTPSIAAEKERKMVKRRKGRDAIGECERLGIYGDIATDDKFPPMHSEGNVWRKSLLSPRKKVDNIRCFHKLI